MPALKKNTLIPSDAETVQINNGIASDPDQSEWGNGAFQKAIPFAKLPMTLQTKLRGRPKADITKSRITIRLSHDVVERFRATGAGWQTRMDQALKEWLKTNAPE